MLPELARYAKQNVLISKPGYKAKKSKWTIAISESGEFVDWLEEKRVNKMCPHLEQPQLVAGGNTRSHFLLDTIQVIAGLGDRNDKHKHKKLIKKHQCFVNMLDIASDHEPRLNACFNFLRSKTQLEAFKQKCSNAKLTDTATFRVGDVYVVDLETWHDWWASYLASIDGNKDTAPTLMRCFMTGELVQPTHTHPKISGLSDVGGQSTGTALISFSKDAFTSYGLKQSQNAACSAEANALYRDALDHLIARAPRPMAGTLYLHWYHQPIPADDDLLNFDATDPSEPDKNSISLRARRLSQAITEGQRPDLTNSTYYVLPLSAVGGRIMVRDWYHGKFPALVDSVNQWLDDLALIKPQGDGITDEYKIAACLTRLVAYRSNEQLKHTFSRIDEELPATVRMLWRSILRQEPLPRDVGSRALTYIRSRLLQNGEDENLDRVACSLLKSWICRENRQNGGIFHMKPELDLQHPSPAYHAGRTMAILAALQQSALGNIGSGPAQRHYALFSAAPALVLSRATKIAQYQLGKLNPGLAHWYDNQLASASISIGTSLPATLTLEEQALFALGYYQQKAALNAYRLAKKAKEEQAQGQAQEQEKIGGNTNGN